MGGEIVAQHDGGNDYTILLTLYRDTLGIPMFTTQDFTIYDATGNSVMTITSALDPNAFHPIFGLPQGLTLPFYPYGVEVYFFMSNVTLPGPGEYTISWNQCCRNGAILNLPDPLNNSLQLHTTVTIDPNQPNSTPYFMVKPVVFLPVNTPWQYNPLPFDPDGDSLAWSLGIPNDADGTMSGSPITGYFDPLSDTTNPISIDPVTGTVSWTASTTGNWVYAVICEEFRNGLKIGEIRRDMQFIVLPSGSLPGFSNLGTITTVNGYPQWSINAGQSSELRFMASDPDTNESVYFEAYGEPFIISNPASFLQEPTINGNEIETVITWTPTSAEVRTDPYLVVLRLMDGTYMFDEAIFIQVNGPVAIEENSTKHLGSIFPNPSNNLIHMPVHLNNSGNVLIKIYDMYGKLIQENDDYFSQGDHLILIPVELSNGQYILSIDQNNKRIGTQNFTVIK
jgi:hypothetical protein